MKTTVLIISIFLVFLVNLKSQWETDTRITFDGGASTTGLNNSKSIACNGDTIHIVWYDNRDGNEEIYYKRSLNNGTTWEQDLRLTNSNGLSNYPAIFLLGLNIRVAWRDSRDGNYEEYYKRSTDGGLTWGADMRLTNAPYTSSIPAILINGSREFIFWHDYRDDGISPEIYFKKSTDGGLTWGSDIRLTNSTSNAETPSVSYSNSIIHLVWADSRSNYPEILYKRSSDDGITWSLDTQLSNNPTSLVSNNPCISSFGSFINITWNDNRDYNYEIYHKRSTNNGNSWSSDNRLTNSSGSSYNSSLISTNSLVQFVWYDDRDGYFKIYYKRSLDHGLSWEPDIQLTTDNTGASGRPSLSASGMQLNIIWSDFRDGNSEIYYKRNPTGNIVNLNNIASIFPNNFSLSQNYPNPFNPVTKIEFSIPLLRGVSEGRGVFVNLTIYDAMGRNVETLHNGELKPGTYETNWNASNFPSGVYFYKLTAGSFTETKKMMLLK